MNKLLPLCFLSYGIQLSIAQEYRFLGSYTQGGTPEYFDKKDMVSPESLNMIDDVLPKRYRVPQLSPQ
ncbi:hypothetical protein [Euzebyella saccharophila]|uniref:Uncharacterized protein n=1 Tax=Euzebyella saccharophila TaxID=679664 RepID=A0ABV8JWF7_9FLAO|nr:hypothetical protein [Euzebyella saccharophila]